jgi:hypothetical protein
MRPTSLKEAVDRIIGGESWVDAISEFLDEFYLSGPSERQLMIGLDPGLTGVAFQDAYVGAVGEHLARRRGLDIPPWADDPRWFLERPHFPDCMELANSVFLRDSPIAFRRLIFTEAEPLRSVRFPREGRLRRPWTGFRGVVQKVGNRGIASGCFQGGCKSHIAAGSPAH